MLLLYFYRWNSLLNFDTITTCIKKLWLGYKVRHLTHSTLTNYLNKFRKNVKKYLNFFKLLCKKKIMGILRLYYKTIVIIRIKQFNEIQFKRFFNKLKNNNNNNKKIKKINNFVKIGINNYKLTNCFEIWKSQKNINNKRNNKIKSIKMNILRSYMYILYNPVKLYYCKCYYFDSLSRKYLKKLFRNSQIKQQRKKVANFVIIKWLHWWLFATKRSTRYRKKIRYINNNYINKMTERRNKKAFRSFLKTTTSLRSKRHKMRKIMHKFTVKMYRLFLSKLFLLYRRRIKYNRRFFTIQARNNNNPNRRYDRVVIITNTLINNTKKSVRQIMLKNCINNWKTITKILKKSRIQINHFSKTSTITIIRRVFNKLLVNNKRIQFLKWCVKRLRQSVKMLFKLLEIKSKKNKRKYQIIKNRNLLKRNILFINFKKLRRFVKRVKHRRNIIKRINYSYLSIIKIKCLQYWRKWKSLRKKFSQIRRRLVFKPIISDWFQLAATSIRNSIIIKRVSSRRHKRCRREILMRWKLFTVRESRLNLQFVIVNNKYTLNLKQTILFSWMRLIDDKVIRYKYNLVKEKNNNNTKRRVFQSWFKDFEFSGIMTYKNGRSAFRNWYYLTVSFQKNKRNNQNAIDYYNNRVIKFNFYFFLHFIIKRIHRKFKLFSIHLNKINVQRSFRLWYR